VFGLGVLSFDKAHEMTLTEIEEAFERAVKYAKRTKRTR
jgi:flagellar assembly factor FliW